MLQYIIDIHVHYRDNILSKTEKRRKTKSFMQECRILNSTICAIRENITTGKKLNIICLLFGNNQEKERCNQYFN